MKRTLALWLSVVSVLWPASRLRAERERFQAPENGPNLGVWRITNDPTVRDWANYHNTQCWSPDGRYLCYTHYGSRLDRGRSREYTTVHVYDLFKDEDRLVDRGHSPRWGNLSNRLFYVHEDPEAGPPYEKGTEVRRLDLDSGGQVRLCYGMERLGETDFEDRWLYAAARYRGQEPEFRVVRIPAGEPGEPEPLPDVAGAQLLPSPGYPAFFTRQDHRSEPFGPTRWWFDLEGKGRSVFAPTLQQCHMGWLGNGEYLLLGNGLIRGRRWNEPFPSNLHILASVGVGDVSPCGRSGRYACGDSTVADLRSGDGWFFIHPLSVVCYPKAVADNSGIYDADPKGSPDGTKVAFVSNYDLKDGPVTHLTDDVWRNVTSLPVTSTEGFPDSGAVVVQREVIGYERKTPSSFEDVTRGLYDTLRVNLRKGRAVTSFEARCLTDDQWSTMPGPSHPMRRSIEDLDSPLIRQRQTDLYVVVVREPDRPLLRAAGEKVDLIPGEEHFETLGYHVLQGEKRMTPEPLRPGARLLLEAGTYRAVAVENSGVESPPSRPLEVTAPTTLHVLADPPAGFSWVRDHWLVDSREVSAEAARRAPEAVREIVHADDGVIHREWHEKGVLTRRHDLGLEGHAIRRTTYAAGKPAVREYHNREGVLLSRERFDAEGFITEWVLFRNGAEQNRWEYDRGTPIRQVRGDTEYVKRGDKFGYLKDGKFIETPRGSLSR
ncbi:MAG: hypothetical protein ACYTG0_12230 [Planctomycetota bacterium]|jgi:hypothetical protein